MPHRLPALGTPARDAFDVADLVAISTGQRPVQCNRHALRRIAREMFAANPAASRAFYFYVDGSQDQLQLVSIGPRGGWKREWVFGPIVRGTVLA